MTAPDQTSDIALPLLRFIPFRRRDIVDMCLSERRLSGNKLDDFRRAAELIDEYFQRDFHALKQQLKDAYAPVDPDADTRCVEGLREAESYDLAEALSNVLNRANYEKVAEAELDAAFESESLFSIRLYVNLDDFEEVLLYTRGANERVEQVPRLLGLFPKTVQFKNYDRVVLYIKFKDEIDEPSTLGGCRPGSTMLKLFQDVPDADLEKLFPNTRVGMRFRDKLLIGIPAMVSGAVVLTTKMGATLVLLASLLGFWLGMSDQEVTLAGSNSPAFAIANCVLLKPSHAICISSCWIITRACYTGCWTTQKNQSARRACWPITFCWPPTHRLALRL